MTAVTSEMTGTVWKVVVDDHAQVQAGQIVMILESMKMEFEVVAPEAGSVVLRAFEGQGVDEGAILFELA